MDERIELSKDVIDAYFNKRIIEVLTSSLPEKERKIAQITMTVYARNGIAPEIAMKIIRELNEELGKVENDFT